MALPREGEQYIGHVAFRLEQAIVREVLRGTGQDSRTVSLDLLDDAVSARPRRRMRRFFTTQGQVNIANDTGTVWKEHTILTLLYTVLSNI